MVLLNENAVSPSVDHSRETAINFIHMRHNIQVVSETNLLSSLDEGLFDPPIVGFVPLLPSKHQLGIQWEDSDLIVVQAVARKNLTRSFSSHETLMSMYKEPGLKGRKLHWDQSRRFASQMLSSVNRIPSRRQTFRARLGHSRPSSKSPKHNRPWGEELPICLQRISQLSGNISG